MSKLGIIPNELSCFLAVGAALIITDAVVTDYLKRIKTTCSEIKEQLNEILSGREVIICPRSLQFRMFKSVDTTYHK